MRLFAAAAVIAGLAIPSGRVMAQDNVFDVRALEFDQHGHTTYQNFIYARTLSSQRVIVQALFLHIPSPEMNYKEFSAGVGLRALSVPGLTVYGMVSVASATDAKYVEPALLVQSTAGKFSASAYLQHYTPVNDRGTDQWLVDPVEAQYTVFGKVAFGGSAYMYRPNGGEWLRKIGPKVSVGDQWGATELRVSRVTSSTQEFQVRRLFIF